MNSKYIIIGIVIFTVALIVAYVVALEFNIGGIKTSSIGDSTFVEVKVKYIHPFGNGPHGRTVIVDFEGIEYRIHMNSYEIKRDNITEGQMTKVFRRNLERV